MTWGFDESVSKSRAASAAQAHCEREIRVAYAKAGEAESAYRQALAEAITRLHGEGVAWSACRDVATGDQHVAALRLARDVAVGVREAAVQAAWRAAADRRDVARFADHSLRRELMENGGNDPRLAWTTERTMV